LLLVLKITRNKFWRKISNYSIIELESSFFSQDWISDHTSSRKQLPLNLPRENCPGHSCVWGGNKCIARSERCGVFVDCLGGEDEIGCNVNWLDLLVGSNTTETQKADINLTSIDPIKEQKNSDEITNKTVIKKNIKPESFRCTKY
jgi:hypothetical protein